MADAIRPRGGCCSRAADAENRNRRRETALGTAPVEHVPDGADVEGAALEHLDQSFLELGSADRIEQLEQPCRARRFSSTKR
jgi:hypothetical protein